MRLDGSNPPLATITPPLSIAYSMDRWVHFTPALALNSNRVNTFSKLKSQL